MNKVAFIGAGNMNAGIISGLVRSGFNANDIMVSNPSAGKREALKDSLGIQETASNIAAAKFADTIVLGVKPHLIADVCQEIAQQLDISDKCFISVAAGCTMAQIQKALGGNASVVRTMPNTPSQLGLGMTGMYASKDVSAAQKDMSEQLMQAAGEIVWLAEEHQIDHIIALSGSGPAYFFLFMEAMEKQALAYGFSPEMSRKIVQQTALGAANMVVHNNELSIGQLRENVTSKGGTTQEALRTFNEGGLPQLVTKAMTAALDRAQEMAQNNQ
ncbi:pyrroline-5-carboxylate reductase [Thalassotalea sp. PLHSN55]|uniref:pyrroline-5-carboxylate reductase n=1 Tax=Thalassotalea sp. PLHSN55 TaxID=3435888 RepID=UPI003F84D0D2